MLWNKHQGGIVFSGYVFWSRHILLAWLVAEGTRFGNSPVFSDPFLPGNVLGGKLPILPDPQIDWINQQLRRPMDTHVALS